MAASYKEAESQLKIICEFSKNETPTGLDVEVLFKNLKEAKSDQLWSDDDAKIFRREIYTTLKFISEIIYNQNVEIEVVNPLATIKILRPGMRLVSRVTERPEAQIDAKWSNEGEDFTMALPLIAIKIIELVVQLPEKALKICSAMGCSNPFVSTHKTKKYCSTTCRNRENTYATRRRLLERLKDAD